MRHSLGARYTADVCSSSMDEAEIKELLRPVKKDLKRLKSGTDSLSREDKITALKECLANIGSRIDDLIVEQGIKSNDDERKFRKHCWVYVLLRQPG